MAALVLGGLVSPGHRDMGMSGGMGDGTSVAQQAEAGHVELTPDPKAPSSSLVADDAAVSLAPPGTTHFRLEVVGGDPKATIEVTTAQGATAVEPDRPLPRAWQLTRSDPADELTVTVSDGSVRGQVQCRVYVGSDLVAVATGNGRVSCTVPASP